MVVSHIPSVTIKAGQRFLLGFEGESTSLVRVGDTVVPSTTIIEGRSSAILQSINFGKELGIQPRDAEKYLLKAHGEIVDKRDAVARRKMAMGTTERVVRSRFDGRVSTERINSGVLDIQAPFSEASMPSGVHGRVLRIFPERAGKREVEIEVTGYVAKPFLCEGINITGHIHVLKDGSSVYRPSDLEARCKGKVVVAGRSLSLKLYESLIEVGARGVIMGGIPLTEYRVIETVAIPIFVTEGWGVIPINTILLNLLREFEGDSCFLDIERGQLVLCPSKSPLEVDNSHDDREVGLSRMEKGLTVQVWDMPYWGYSGKIVQMFEEENLVQVMFDSGRKVLVDQGSVVAISEG